MQPPGGFALLTQMSLLDHFVVVNSVKFSGIEFTTLSSSNMRAKFLSFSFRTNELFFSLSTCNTIREREKERERGIIKKAVLVYQCAVIYVTLRNSHVG